MKTQKSIAIITEKPYKPHACVTAKMPTKFSIEHCTLRSLHGVQIENIILQLRDLACRKTSLYKT